MKMQSQAIVIGVSLTNGISKESQNPYEICRVMILNEGKGYEREGFKRQVWGQEAVEAECSREAVDQLKNISLPATCTLDIENTARQGKLTSTIVGVRIQKAA